MDIVSSHEVAQNSKPDAEQLLYAAQEGRCLVTGDLRDFVGLTTYFVEHGLPHAGVLVLSPSFQVLDFTAVVRSLVAYQNAHPEGMTPYGLQFLSPADMNRSGP
jgi:hypothetical protein